MKAWIDRSKLESQAKTFARRHGYFMRQNAKRISSMVEIAAFHSIVDFYESRGWAISVENPGPKMSFRYKLTASGLEETFSYFKATKDGETVCIYSNTAIQSAHDDHLYFTADVVVSSEAGAETQKLLSGRRHSFVRNGDIVTFAEVKHLVPFPEVLFNFSGIVLEFLPEFIDKKIVVDNHAPHLCPILVFSGSGSEHVNRVRDNLSARYHLNIIYGSSRHEGRIIDFPQLKKYASRKATVVGYRVGKHKRRLKVRRQIDFP